MHSIHHRRGARVGTAHFLFIWMDRTMYHSLQTKTLVRLCAVATLAATGVSAALAGAAPTAVTRGAMAVTTDLGKNPEGADISAVINRSGLAMPYTNGLTSFETFAGTTHNNTEATIWGSHMPLSTGPITFDLGAAYNIDGLAWFGMGDGFSSRVNRIEVYADNNGVASDGSTLLFDSGYFAAMPSSNNGRANLFEFNDVSNTRYLHIQIVNVAGGPNTSAAVGEVVFRQNVSAVPEPGTYALMGLGLLAIGLTQRRRITQR